MFIPSTLISICTGRAFSNAAWGMCRCVITKDGEVIARGSNLTNETRNVSCSYLVHGPFVYMRIAHSGAS